MNVNWEKIHSLILCVTCHGLRNFPCPYTSPQNHLWIFKTLWVIIFWVKVTRKMLNVNWEKIHSLILCVTCHGVRNFPCPYTFPQNHLWIFKTLWVIIFWVRVTCKMLNVNWEKIHSLILCVTCHGLRNFASPHTHPPKTIHEFSKPYELLFSELESLIKLYKNLLNNFICHLSWLEKLSPSHTHPLISIREFLKP